MVLLGERGRLGSALASRLRGAAQVADLRGFDRAALNLADAELLSRALGALEFDVLINAAAHTAVDDCEIDTKLAFLVNGEAPGTIARICAEKRARMIHFSTDYVFDGMKSEPYTERDTPRPISVYGESKLAGEHAVLTASDGHLVIRLSWLFGPGRRAFPEWVIDQARRKERVTVVSDKVASPTYAPDVADWTLALLERPSASGLLHACNDGACAWSEYGAFVLERAVALGLRLRSTTVTPIPIASLVGLSARRPPYSALDTSRLRELTGRSPRPWREAVAEHLSGMVAAGA